MDLGLVPRSGAFLGGLFIFSVCLCGFPLCPPASSHSPSMQIGVSVNV